jgi:hypothetical protein
MRKLFMAVLFAASVTGFGTADAAGGCGAGCYTAPRGGCVVNGWGTAATTGISNECPVWTRPRPPCPYGYSWKFGACFMSK